MSGWGRLSYQSVEVRVGEVLEDQLDVDVVLGAGGEELQLQHGGQVLRLVPEGKEDHQVVATGQSPVPRSSYCLSIRADSPHHQDRLPDWFSISGGLGLRALVTWHTSSQHPVNTQTTLRQLHTTP